MAIERHEFSEIGSALIITDDESSYQRAVLNVEKHSELLTVTVTSNTALEKEVNSRYFRVFSPNGEIVNPTGEGKNGQLVYLVHNPAPGEWEISIEGKTSDLQINAAVVKKGWWERLKNAAWRTSCKVCTIILRGLFIALLLHLAGIVVSTTIIATVAAALHLAPETFKSFLEFLLDLIGIGERVDRIMEKACGWLGYCGPDHY